MREKILKALICVTTVLVTMLYTEPYEVAESDGIEFREVLTESEVPITVVAKEIESEKPDEIQTTTTFCKKDAFYSASKFRTLGIIEWNGWRWTYYSEKVLPGRGLEIPGRHNDSEGYVCDENDYICLSSSSLSKGTVIDTPFGKQGKVYDTGCPKNVIDVYVSW